MKFKKKVLYPSSSKWKGGPCLVRTLEGIKPCLDYLSVIFLPSWTFQNFTIFFLTNISTYCAALKVKQDLINNRQRLMRSDRIRTKIHTMNNDTQRITILYTSAIYIMGKTLSVSIFYIKIIEKPCFPFSNPILPIHKKIVVS